MQLLLGFDNYLTKIAIISANYCR